MLELKNIKRNTNDFSFTETVASLANNRDFRKGYADLTNGKTNDKTYFWSCLSAVGEEIGEVIYENVLNYINNVSNINTCKLRPLTSIAKILGVTEFAVLKNLKAIPEDILKMMDIFSINRNYLLNIRYFDTEFVKDLLSSTLDEETLQTIESHIDELDENDSNLYSVLGAISDEKYQTYVEKVFFNVLASKIFQTYGSKVGDFVYQNLLDLGNLSVTNSLAEMRSGYIGNDTYNIYSINKNNSTNVNYAQRLYKFKKSFNLSPGFNEHQIVDNIENGLDFIENYNGGELSVIMLEIQERAKPKYLGKDGYDSTRLDTRFSYYNEMEVKNFIKFADDVFLLNQTKATYGKSIEEISASYLDWTPYLLSNNFWPYDIDENFTVISGDNTISFEQNVNDQFESYKNLIGRPDTQFSSFIYDYYTQFIESGANYSRYFEIVNPHLSSVSQYLVTCPPRYYMLLEWLTGLHKALSALGVDEEVSVDVSSLDSFSRYLDKAAIPEKLIQVISWVRDLHRVELDIIDKIAPDNIIAKNRIEAFEKYLGNNSPIPNRLSVVIDWIRALHQSLQDVTSFTEDDKLAVLANGNAMRIIARILKDICLSVVDIREKLKTQSQRNYMTGTKLLIEYILDEYLINSLIHTYGVDPISANNPNLFAAKIVEYIDTTEYYNIGLSIENNLQNDMAINMPFFNDLSGGGQNATQTGVGLGADNIRRFYMKSLNLDSKYLNTKEDYFDFMSAVYEIGTSQTYTDSKNGTIVFSKDLLDDSLSLYVDFGKISSKYDLTSADIEYLNNRWCVKDYNGMLSVNLDVLTDYYDDISSEIETISSDIEKYNASLSARIDQQTELMLKYHGTDIAYYPWYNYKNKNFPTFQSHPYLYNFVEHTDDSYPIENAFYGNANEDLIYELQSQNISVYLGEYGNIKRIWRNSNLEYSGYKSRYENSLHQYGTSNSTGLYSVTHYDGIFYPPAIELYKRYADLANPLTEVISGQTYSGFNLLEMHMVDCVDSDYYTNSSGLDIPQISSMWHYYSHLGLKRNERLHIVNQLKMLSADIMDMASAAYREQNSNGYTNAAEPYDVFKYGLDYNKNSLILLKRYVDENNNIRKNEEVSYNDKRNTTGQFWIKLNSHPIAFPAFICSDSLSSYSQVALDTSVADDWNYIAINNVFNETTRKTKFGNKQTVDNIYDFDLTENGSYIAYAIENPSSLIVEKTYKNSVSIAAKIVQRHLVNYYDPSAEKTIYQLTKYGASYLYPSNAQALSSSLTSLNSLDTSDYEFDGYFQAGNIFYAGYFKRNKNADNENVLDSVSVNAIAYPGNVIQSKNSDSVTFAFDKSYNVSAINNDFAFTKKDAHLRLGYTSDNSSGTFTLAVVNEIKENKKQYIQDFIGFNSIVRKNSEDHLSGFGYTEYIEASGGKSNIDSNSNVNSFDRFSSIITLYDIPCSVIAGGDVDKVNTMLYALNSDASYVPLYYGKSGQNIYSNLKDTADNAIGYNEQWHRSDLDSESIYVSKQSIELLGYSRQDFNKRIEEKEDTIFYDGDIEKYMSIDSNNLLCATFRVYEDFNLSGFVFEKYNDGFLWKTTDPDTMSISFDIDMPTLNSETSSLFNILLLNAGNGKDRNPILAGSFSQDTISNVFYDVEASEDESFLLMTGYKPDNKVNIVGTPDPFDVNDVSFNVEYSNHVLNVSKIIPSLTYENGKFKLTLELHRNSNKRDFAVQTNQLLLFVYSSRLEQFEKFHYMEPTGKYPFNAAISSWNMPWKNAKYSWMYENGFQLSDGWQNNNKYIDKRSISKIEYYKTNLQNNGAAVSAIVGNLPISAYNYSRNDLDNYGKLSISNNDPRLTNLSIMETIDLSSISSFNQNYWLSSGQIVWKISEEDKVPSEFLKYPPTIVDMLLYEKFHGTNKEHIDYNFFELSNTYIFQLEDPISVANRIGTIAVPIGTVAEEFELVYEDYLSDQLSVDIGGVNLLNYLQIQYDPTSLSNAIVTQYSGSVDATSELSDINSVISSISDIETALNIAETSAYFVEGSEKNNKTNTLDFWLFSVDPKDIEKYLKIYVNWRKYRDPGHSDDEIELFFNFPNLFLSPYSCKTADGYYTTEFKPNTYLKLKSGEDGFLYIIFQFKYYDSSGILCGIRDLPVITYRIFNVSDDKPKFVITKTYEIDNRDGKYTYPGNDDENVVYLIVDSRTYRHDEEIDNSSGIKKKLNDMINYDYTLDEDLYLNTKIKVLSPIPLTSLNIDMIYDRGKMPGTGSDDDPEFVLEPTLSKPGEFSDYKGNVKVNFDINDSEAIMEFTMLRGSSINEETLARLFSIEFLNATGKDVFGNTPKFVFINGYVEVNDYTEDIKTGAYLARELNYNKMSSITNPDDKLSIPALDNAIGNAGWIREEQQNALIRMYSVGRAVPHQKLLATIETDINVPLKTTGTRESRFDSTNNLYLIATDVAVNF